MDKLKQYIQENKLLGDIEPRDGLWSAIDEQLDIRVQAPVRRIWIRYAAAVIIAGMIWGAAMIWTKPHPAGPGIAVTIKPVKDTAAAIMPKSDRSSEKAPVLAGTMQPRAKSKTGAIHATEKTQEVKAAMTQEEEATVNMLASVDHSFAALISLQKDKVNHTPVFAENPAYFNDFYAQLKQMDQDERLVRKKIAENGLTEELLTQLININQLKLTVLKKLQIEINKTNSRYQQQKDPNRIQNNYFLHL